MKQESLASCRLPLPLSLQASRPDACILEHHCTGRVDPTRLLSGQECIHTSACLGTMLLTFAIRPVDAATNWIEIFTFSYATINILSRFHTINGLLAAQQQLHRAGASSRGACAVAATEAAVSRPSSDQLHASLVSHRSNRHAGGGTICSRSTGTPSRAGGSGGGRAGRPQGRQEAQGMHGIMITDVGLGALPPCMSAVFVSISAGVSRPATEDRLPAGFR